MSLGISIPNGFVLPIENLLTNNQSLRDGSACEYILAIITGTIAVYSRRIRVVSLVRVGEAGGWRRVRSSLNAEQVQGTGYIQQ